VLSQRQIEENLWRAIRWGMDGEMIDFGKRGLVPTRQVLEDVVDWTAPARELIGLEVEIPERNGAQRARAAVAEGRPIEEIYRHAVEETAATYPPSPVPVGDD
jgi:glutamate---cysteine ligase / carboxylate-amine ligase